MQRIFSGQLKHKPYRGLNSYNIWQLRVAQLPLPAQRSPNDSESVFLSGLSR